MLGERLDRWERIFYVVILILALFSRFYILGARAISHDESIHTKFSWNFFNDLNFQHNPMMHGPLLFEATALNYYLFGVSDFTSRIYTAALGVLLVMTPLLFRKWCGKKGAAFAAVMLLVSPSISYYARYIRHDTPVMLFAVLWIWTLFSYLDDGKVKWLYWMAAFFSLMHASKEVNYIYVAITVAMLFLPFLWQISSTRWKRPQWLIVLALVLIVALVLGGLFALSFSEAQVEQQNLDEAGNTRVVNVALPLWGRVAGGTAFLLLLGALFLVYYGVGEEQMQQIRLFDVLMAVGTLTLPIGSALFIKFVVDVDMGVVYNAVQSGNFAAMTPEMITNILVVLALLILVSVVLGLWWNRRHWPVIALIHYTLFFVTYSSVFTWGWGILSGMVGSLAYWLAQQGVERGGQPMYYYLLIGPLYEYLPVLFSIPAGIGGIFYLLAARKNSEDSAADKESPSVLSLERYFPVFLSGWTVLAWLAYTYAGEKMPWLLVHIALPSIFMAAWGLGWLADNLDWGALWSDERTAIRWGMLVFPVALILLVASMLTFVGAVSEFRHAMGDGMSTAGPTLTQLDPFGKVLGGIFGTGIFFVALFWSGNALGFGRSLRLSGLALATLLAALTVRTMLLLNFVNYDMANEFLIYAHGTPDIKIALKQVQDISWIVTGTPTDVKVAYSEDGSWPLTWYMVDYPNNYFFGTKPDPNVLPDCPVVISGSGQYGVVEEILGSDYVSYDYKYLWWPIEDYRDLTWERIRNVLTNPELRQAIWDILWNRDYARYAALKNPTSPFTFKTWPYRRDFRLYVRKDLAAETWGYVMDAGGVAAAIPVASTPAPDPYAAGDRILPVVSTAVLANSAPRGLAVAADGTLYVADTAQHRVWHITPQGMVRHVIGEYGTEPGQFNEPWGVAVDSDGNLYVADTWNHRVQKFDANGQYLTHWGTAAQANISDPSGQGVFFGPRGVAIGPDNQVYVTDTGNKRVQIFTADGQFVRQFGSSGSAAGLFNEPVGIAVAPNGDIFVADMWNLRMQVFSSRPEVLRQWDMPGWNIDNPEEKAFVALNDETLYVSDPMNRRVLAFTLEGSFLWDISANVSEVALLYPTGVAVYDNILYVADAHTAQVLGYRLPE
ncbi:MAG: TIGR03663 family protein [Anaerolineae bacterium]|nr:TIGR03663 family protein [Anaerolineae bacterium]